MATSVFFSRLTKPGIRTGREMLSGLLWTAFVQAEPAASRVEAPWWGQSPLGALVRGLRGWLDGLDLTRVNECVAKFEGREGVLFVDGSNYGRLAAESKRRQPGVSVVTFFHNVEARFFWDAFRQSKSIRSLMVALCNYLAERKAVLHSDVLVFLNQRDATLASRLYCRVLGKSRVEIFPMCIADHSEAEEIVRVEPEQPRFGLFVGGAFFANVHGVRWFCENVASLLPSRVFIVGKGFEDYRDELESFGNITVVGTVEHVSEWYARASFIISPIFHGSGMKTKTAEATQFGRPVLGTPEAFVGFEAHVESIGRICHTQEDFIRAVSDLVEDGSSFDSVRIRSVFLENFSERAAGARMSALLESLVPAEGSVAQA